MSTLTMIQAIREVVLDESILAMGRCVSDAELAKLVRKIGTGNQSKATLTVTLKMKNRINDPNTHILIEHWIAAQLQPDLVTDTFRVELTKSSDNPYSDYRLTVMSRPSLNFSGAISGRWSGTGKPNVVEVAKTQKAGSD